MSVILDGIYPPMLAKINWHVLIVCSSDELHDEESESNDFSESGEFQIQWSSKSSEMGVRLS